MAFLKQIPISFIMGVVQKQSIQSSLFMYGGFAIGAFNFWLLPHILTTEEFGLVRMMMSICTVLAGVCSLGMKEVITRFYPYYDEAGKKHKSDLISWVFLIPLLGFSLLVIGTLLFKGLIIRKFGENAALLLHYFYLIYPFVFFIMMFSLLERIAWSRQFTVLSNLLKESGVRLFTSLIVIALALHWLGFTGFMTLYSLQFAVVSLILFYFLFIRKDSGFVFKVSSLTRRLYNKMGTYALFMFGGGVFILFEQYFNTILLGSRESLTTAGVFDIAFYMATLILVPKRSMQAAASATISRALKNRDLDRIERVYKKSSATLLIIGLFILGLIWLNLDDIFMLYKPEYSAGKYIVLFVGLANLTDLGTGLNYDILVNSKYWNIYFTMNVILTIFFFAVTYFMVVAYGMMGSAYSILISLSTYNIVRSAVIWWKFKLQPFTIKTLFILLTGIVAYCITAYLIPEFHSVFINIAFRSLVFLLIFAVGVLGGRLSEDISQLFYMILQKTGIRKE